MDSKISVKNLDMAYGGYVVMEGISFDVQRGEVFLIIGRSGCGKSTLLKYLLGLKHAGNGKIFYDGVDANELINGDDFYGRKIGVLYQGGALWSSMTLAENVALPLETYTDLSSREIKELVDLKLALVGLKNFEDFYPAQISGGMKKRAGLARAMALDPEILFFDEPSAGLDPVSARRLDDLILELKDGLGITIIAVTHELASIFAIGTRAMYLDVETKTATAIGAPKELLASSRDKNVVAFLSRGTKTPALTSEERRMLLNNPTEFD
ncbi:MAG: ATP-binding cassette domain-containing protein [Puniceicoccales bacterium]|jgi:phospholipid/cholesterol/gamma-HCH transport system ATP-binding protein|nr:ATP-binding cassette domain-containing protein [Puniceicoccales bacterium]